MSLAKKFQVPADRTILTPAAQPIAHFENYAPIFCEQIFMLMTLLNFESQQAPKPVDPELCHSKKLFLRLFFGKNPHFHPFWSNVDPPSYTLLESHGSQLSNRVAQSKIY